LYPDTGSYQVILHVIDSNGCANENAPPYVQKVNPLSAMNFTWSVDPAVAVVDNLQFTATVDTTYGNVTSWHWDFGDGDTANIQNPTHQYSAVGQYSVTLSIVVSGFSPNSLTKTVTVAPLPAPDFSVSPVCLNDTTFFTDLSTTPVGTIQTWKWYFGDGDSLIINQPGNPNVKHIYGTQTVYPPWDMSVVLQRILLLSQNRWPISLLMTPVIHSPLPFLTNPRWKAARLSLPGAGILEILFQELQTLPSCKIQPM